MVGRPKVLEVGPRRHFQGSYMRLPPTGRLWCGLAPLNGSKVTQESVGKNVDRLDLRYYST